MDKLDIIYKKLYDREELIKILKWFRDEYTSPNVYSSIDQMGSANESARKCLINILLDGLEGGKNEHTIEAHRTVFLNVTARAILLYNKLVVDKDECAKNNEVS